MSFDPVIYSRSLTGMTLAFHILFATIGVGIPVMIAIAHFIGLKKNDPLYLLMARRWMRGFSITVAVGVVTGTAIGLQLSLLWPSFMALAGQVISLPLFLETFAFFIEAIFLGIYIYTWDRFKKPWLHFLLLIPVIIGSTASALFITTVNAFMNTPDGFEMKDGAITAIDPLAAMFNPAAPSKIFHVVSTAYMTSAFVLVTIAAFYLLKGKRHAYYKKSFKMTMIAGLIFSILTLIAGDVSGKFLAEKQPEKLAAAEWHFKTEEHAPLYVFGTRSGEEVNGAIVLPGFLSFLAHSNFNAEVTGLEETPKKYWPPLFIHYLFDLMVSIGIFLTVLSFIYPFLKKWRENWLYSRFYLILAALAGPLAMAAIELGWLFTEFGRQPWILRSYLVTKHAATTSQAAGWMFYLFILVYLVLAIGCIRAMRKLFKDQPPENEFEKMG